MRCFRNRYRHDGVLFHDASCGVYDGASCFYFHRGCESLCKSAFLVLFTHTHTDKLRSPVWNLFVLMRAIMLVLLVLMLLVLMLAMMLVQDMRLRPLIHHPCLPKEDKFSKHKGTLKCQEN